MEDEERLNESVPDSVVIKYLQKEIKNLKVELGKDKSYIAELEDSLEKEKLKSADIRNLRIETRKEVIKETLYKNLKVQLASNQKTISQLKSTRDKLMFLVNKYRRNNENSSNK